MLLLFEVRCIAAWKTRRAFGRDDFAAHERERAATSWGLVVAEGEGKERRGRMVDERMKGQPFPGQVMTHARPPGFLPGSSN